MLPITPRLTARERRGRAPRVADPAQVDRARRAVLKSLTATAAVASGVAAFRPAAAAPLQIRIGYQPSLNYLPLMIVQHEKLVEQRLQGLGVRAEMSWLNFSSGTAMNDALLSGQVDIASGGISILAILWEKTRRRLDVNGLTSLAASPFFLNANKPSLRSIEDFSDSDRIALPAVKTSPNAIVLQMAAEAAFGPGEHARLDHLMVSMPNPDAQAALLSRHTEIVAHMAAPPFCFEQLSQPGIHRILSSSDVLGAGASTIVTWATKPFVTERPDVAAAFIATVRDANDMIERDPARAASIYKAAMQSSQSVAELEAIIRRPEISFSVTPRNSLAMIDFMYRIGELKSKPADWKELFFANIHDLPGS